MSDSLWPGLAAWVALYCSDYALTLHCARLYRAGVNEKIVFEGSYELNPYFQEEIDALRVVSPRFVLALLWTSGSLGVVWLITRQTWLWPGPYLFLLGALLLMELAIHVRHLRNLYLFTMALRSDAVRGRIEYGRRLMLTASSIELAAFSLLFLVAFLVAGSPFLLGGSVMCLSTALRHWRLARQHAKTRR